MVMMIFFKFLYISGLAFIIPYVLALQLPPAIIVLSGTRHAMLAIAIFLVLFSFYGVFSQNRYRLNKTLKQMGIMTLVPGLLSLFFSLFGEYILLAIAKTLENYSTINELVMTYIDHAIIKVRILTLCFIFLGIILYYAGGKIKK